MLKQLRQLRHLKLFLFIILCCVPNAANALESYFSHPDIPGRKRVAILPFDIHSQEDISYLRNRIPEVIGNHLEQEGAALADPSALPDLNQLKRSIEGIRKIGRQTRSDYVIWGSVTRIGQKFSLDAKILPITSKEAPGAFFVEGESFENLSSIVMDIASNFGMKIFKRERVAKVLVRGNKRIESDAIREKIKTRPGKVYLAKSLSQDLKTIYDMGYFDDIQIEAEDGAGGKTIIFRVKEKSTVRYITIRGNVAYEENEVKEALNVKTGSILNVFELNKDVERVESLYKEKNYHNAIVSYDVIPAANNQADLEFVIEEGKKIRIRTITFVGNKAYSEKKLEKLMKTSEKGFWSWLTSSGELNKETLSQDIGRVAAFYYNNGYMEAKVGEPEIRYEGEWIYITIKITEGQRFKVGAVKIAGDMIRSEQELMRQIKITNEEFYNREVIRNDILKLTDIYGNEGYAFADITPRVDKDMSALKTDITYDIQKKKQVYFEKITISGNVKTRDKIIRRELKVREQELYSVKNLKRSVRNLYRLDYFKDVKVEPSQGSSDDKMLLNIEVEEKPTGDFSFGGGYSSVEDVFFMASATQRNLFGRGQILQLKGEIGGTSDRYTLSFTEPWLFDIPLSAGFDIYNWKRDYDTYDKRSRGGGIRFGYPVFDYTRAYFSYKYETNEIDEITEDASDSVRELAGTNVTSSVSTTLQYDSKDRVFNPTEGGDHSITLQYAGLGGDIAFTKYLAEAGQYFPLFWGTVGFLHARGGYVTEGSDGKLPDYEKFYLGGMNSLRGFDWRDICVTDENGDEIGGEKFVQFNVEFLVPLIKQAGLMGVVFYDTGNVYGEDESMDFGDLRKSAGFGFRWYSPMGAIRIENGYILDPKEGESSGGRWEFTMGNAF